VTKGAAAGALTVATMTHMTVTAVTVVAWLGIRVGVLRVESTMTHRICHVVMSSMSSVAGGWTVRGRAGAIVVLIRAVILTRVETSVSSTCIGLGLALLAGVVRAAAVDVLGKECSKVVLEALCFLQVELFLCLLYMYMY